MSQIVIYKNIFYNFLKDWKYCKISFINHYDNVNYKMAPLLFINIISKNKKNYMLNYSNYLISIRKIISYSYFE